MGGPRCQDDVVILRPRQPSDDDAIQRLSDAAFGGPDESRLIAALRDGGLAAIELVAAQGEAVVGHLLLSKLAVTLGGRGLRALALAPMAVAPDRQRQGIGSALVRAGLQAAREGGWQAVIVLGHPDFYSRFGFSAGKAALLEAPFRGSAFMALELETGVLAGRGRVVYPPPFGLGG
jgi:putative acetyltransferase